MIFPILPLFLSSVLGAGKEAIGLIEGVADSAASLSEQRSLSPPAEVSAVLEACSADVAQLQQQLTPFVEQWQKRAQTVQSLNTENDVVELAGHQNASAEAARRICDDVRRLLESLQGRIDGLDKSGGGGTRA